MDKKNKERQIRRIEQGTHNFLKSGVTVLNIKTEVISKVSVLEYRENLEIYCTVASNKFKEWKNARKS